MNRLVESKLYRFPVLPLMETPIQFLLTSMNPDSC
ncbi:unnamed protein product [Brassica oleracea]